VNPCHRNLLKDEIKVIGVTFGTCKNCPEILELSSVPSQFNAKITAKLNKKAFVYCAAFEKEAPLIETQVIMISNSNSTSLILSGLNPFTTYFLYCYATEIKPKVLSMPYNVFSSKFTTLCCTNITFDIANSILPLAVEGSYVPNFATISTRQQLRQVTHNGNL
jgi:hypothetical protein